MRGPDCADELDANFTIHKVQQITLAMKNNKSTGCDNTPVEVQKMLVTKCEITKTLTKLFNTTNLSTEGKSGGAGKLRRNFHYRQRD
jgi:glycine cleavage system regulatory protein